MHTIVLAFRNLLRHTFRTGMTLAVIAFGVATLFASGGFVRDVYVQLGEALIHSQSGHLQVARAGFFTYGSRSPEKFAIDDPERLRAAIASDPRVDDVLARIQFSGLLSNGRTNWAIVGEGIEADKETKLSSSMRIIAGRSLTNSDRFEILVGEGVAQSLRLRPGSAITLVLPTAEGALNSLDFEVAGVFRSFSKDFDARAVRIPLQAAQELLDSKRVNTLVVSLKHTDAANDVAARLRTAFPTGIEVRTWVELNDFYEKTVALYDQQFGFLQLIILLMVLLTVGNSINMSVFERTGEFGTMMALGNRGRSVFGLVALEGVILGFIGSLIGLAFGLALAYVVSRIGIPMPPPPNANLGYVATIRIVPSVASTAFLVGLAASAAAAVISGLRVARLPIVDALRANV